MNKFKYIADGKVPKDLQEESRKKKLAEKALEFVLRESDRILAKDKNWRSQT